MNYFIKKLLYLFRYIVNSKKFKRLITIILIVFVLLEIYDLYYSKVHAAEEITSPYYFDGVQATYQDYEAIQNDFVARVCRDIRVNNGIPAWLNVRLGYLANGGYRAFFYYGDALGTQYQNTYPSASDKNTLEVIFMDGSQISSITHDYDWGLCGIQSVRGYVCATTYYEFKYVRATSSLTTLAANTARHWLPSYLLDYRSDTLVEFIRLYQLGQLTPTTAANILQAIENQTSVIEEQRTNNNK